LQRFKTKENSLNRIRSWLVYFFDVHGDTILVTVMDSLCSNIDMNVTFSSCILLTRHACTLFITAWPPDHAQNSYFEPIAKFCHNLVVIAMPGQAWPWPRVLHGSFLFRLKNLHPHTCPYQPHGGYSLREQPLVAIRWPGTMKPQNP
jgi:hypothetical protein